MKKFSSVLVLITFLFNAAVSDMAFCENYRMVQKDTLAPAARTFDSDISPDINRMAKVKWALLNFLTQQGVTGRTIDMAELKRYARKLSDDSIFWGADHSIYFLFNEMSGAVCDGRGISLAAVKCEVTDKYSPKVPEVYYAFFSLNQQAPGFAVEVYTKDEAEEIYQKFKEGIDITAQLPERAEERRKAMDLYNWHNAEIDSVIKDLIASGRSFAEIEGRAKSLGWDEKYPLESAGGKRKAPTHIWKQGFLDGMKWQISAVLEVFNVPYDEAIKDKNIVFIRTPDGRFPIIEEDGVRIQVTSHTSENAIYFFLNDAVFDMLARENTASYDSLKYTDPFNNLCKDYLHELGVICGLEGNVKDSRIVNDLDMALKACYLDTIFHSSNREGQLQKLFPDLKDSLRVVNLDKELINRDYTTGTVPTPDGNGADMAVVTVADKVRMIGRLKEAVDLSDINSPRLLDANIFRAIIPNIAFQAANSKDNDLRAALQTLILKLAPQMGARSASVRALYKGKEQIQKNIGRNFTLPSMNLRCSSFNQARTAFDTAKSQGVGALQFELAPTEAVYTGQTLKEFAAMVMAGAVAAGYTGPVFMKLDHMRVDVKKYADDPDKELKRVFGMLKDAIDAGIYAIDIDTSVLEADPKIVTDPVEQQRGNFTASAKLVEAARIYGRLNGVDLALGVEVGEVGEAFITEDHMRAFLGNLKKRLANKGAELGFDIEMPDVLAIPSGSQHGGVRDAAGNIMENVNIAFDLLVTAKRVCAEYGMAGPVQHGASTLPTKMFDMFPARDVTEIHLATALELLFRTEVLDKAVLDQMTDEFIASEAGQKVQAKQTAKGLPPLSRDAMMRHFDARKLIIEYKQAFWTGDIDKGNGLLADLIATWFNLLGVNDTADAVRKLYADETAKLNAASAQEIAVINGVMKKAGEAIPHSPAERYTLIVPVGHDSFCTEAEVKKQKDAYEARCDIATYQLGTFDCVRTLEYIKRNIMNGNGQRAVVLIPKELMAKNDINEFLKGLKEYGIRFIVADLDELTRARSIQYGLESRYNADRPAIDPQSREEAQRDIKRFQESAYAAMLLVRKMTAEDAANSASPVYRALDFYLRTHFSGIGEGLSAGDYIKAVAASDIPRLIRAVLIFRPTCPVNAKADYDKVSHTLIFA